MCFLCHEKVSYNTALLQNEGHIKKEQGRENNKHMDSAKSQPFITLYFSIARTELAGLKIVLTYLHKRIFDLVSVCDAYFSRYTKSAT